MRKVELRQNHLFKTAIYLKTILRCRVLRNVTVASLKIFPELKLQYFLLKVSS